MEERKKQAAAAAKPASIAVKDGDNLYKIAKRSGVSVEALKRVNGLIGDSVRVGQKLKIL